MKPVWGLPLFLLAGLPGGAQQAPEMETKEAPAKFSSRVNLVPVPVVVRDKDGKAVGNLTKEDFRLLDNGKVQVISRFDIEKPGAPVVLQKDSGDIERAAEGKAPEAGAASPVLADHFVAYVFDDVHANFEDLARARDAALRVISGTTKASDRSAIFTTSGQVTLDFTADKEKLQETLGRLHPASLTGGVGHGLECPDISFYMADRMVNLNDPQAIQVALINYQTCSNNQYATANEVVMLAQRALHDGEHETQVSAKVLDQIVRRLSAMPGQRNLVLASPGFFVPFTDQQDITDLINRAVRANVVVSTLDIRGLWTPPAYQATSAGAVGGSLVVTMMNQYMNDEQLVAESVLEDLAHSTGGDWFHNNNDLNDGFRRLAAAPEFIYVLAFTPENLKSDGKYHKLQVTLRDAKGLTLQVRKGYYAPRQNTNPGDQEKQEIEDAVFSREVIRDIPLSLHTQYFRSGDVDANLSVVAQLDIKSLHYKKADGRNLDTLQIVSALFDLNGNFISGEQKTLDLKLKDETLDKRLESGIRIKTSFPVKLGSYVLRVVVRDSQGQMMASDNTSVDIK